MKLQNGDDATASGTVKVLKHSREIMDMPTSYKYLYDDIRC